MTTRGRRSISIPSAPPSEHTNIDQLAVNSPKLEQLLVRIREYTVQDDLSVIVPDKPQPDIAPGGPIPNNEPDKDRLLDPSSTPGEGAPAGGTPSSAGIGDHTERRGKQAYGPQHHQAAEVGQTLHRYCPGYFRTTNARRGALSPEKHHERACCGDASPSARLRLTGGNPEATGAYGTGLSRPEGLSWRQRSFPQDQHRAATTQKAQ